MANIIKYKQRYFIHWRIAKEILPLLTKQRLHQIREGYNSRRDVIPKNANAMLYGIDYLVIKNRKDIYYSHSGLCYIYSKTKAKSKYHKSLNKLYSTLSIEDKRRIKWRKKRGEQPLKCVK